MANLENVKGKARISLVLSPEIKDTLCLLAELNGLSTNEFISSVLDVYVKNVQKNAGLIEKLSAAKKEFDDTRRKLAEAILIS